MDDRLNTLFLEMMNILHADPTDNPRSLKNDISMQSNYIIYSAIHHLIKIYDLIENKKMNKDYYIFINKDEEKIVQEIIHLIKRYMEIQGDKQYINNIKATLVWFDEGDINCLIK